MAGKSRLDVLSALQGRPEGGLLFVYNENTAQWLDHFKVGRKHLTLLEKLFRNKPPFTIGVFIEELDKAAPNLVDSNVFERIANAFALGHYHTQKDFPIVQLLLSDGGKEYGHLASVAHPLCWLHDERHYRLLNPKLNLHRKALDNFLHQYWDYYRQLLDFKELPLNEQAAQKASLEQRFDEIFSRQTPYFDLNKLIQKTFAKKEQLLLVLKFPFLPLHNNAAELAVRRKVRKRDISLHTMSERGTKSQDAFMTVVHTAAKLGVSAFDYLADRISHRFNMPSLADLVAQNYHPVTTPL
jgi:transposase IS66 family protein